MTGKVVSFSERLFFLMVWVIIVIILAGFILHIASSRGIFPGVTAWIGRHTNLAAQAGA